MAQDKPTVDATQRQLALAIFQGNEKEISGNFCKIKMTRTDKNRRVIEIMALGQCESAVRNSIQK